MPKFYVKSGKQKQILQEKYPVIAAVRCFMLWKQDGLEIAEKINVSELGFEEHNDDIKDCSYSQKYIKALAT